jgi:hypothetical protein
VNLDRSGCSLRTLAALSRNQCEAVEARESEVLFALGSRQLNYSRGSFVRGCIDLVKHSKEEIGDWEGMSETPRGTAVLVW